jgi:hypothetical protein
MPTITREGSRRFHDKFPNYRHCIRSDRFREKYTVGKRIYVITVRKGAGRRDNLARYAADVVPEGDRKYFLFGWIEAFLLSNPILSEPVFLSQTAMKPVALLGEPEIPVIVGHWTGTLTLRSAEVSDNARRRLAWIAMIYRSSAAQ